jgi:SAM-dependent methyltransferase
LNFVDVIAGHPTVYGWIQDLAGRRTVVRQMQAWLDRISGRVLDVGGGTGRISEQLRDGVRYVCIDPDPKKLAGLKGRTPAIQGLAGDGVRLPFGAGVFDAALLVGVTHHLAEDALRDVIAEIARVLAPHGRLIMLDALWTPRRLASRALWACDRGSHPRTAAVLDAAFRAHFDIDDTMRFAVLHEYLALQCRRRPQA